MEPYQPTPEQEAAHQRMEMERREIVERLIARYELERMAKREELERKHRLIISKYKPKKVK